MLEHALHLAGSPWIYAVVVLFVAADGVFTFLPSDSLVICLSALSIGGAPSLAPLVTSAALGAVVGDWISYALGRRATGWLGPPKKGAVGAAFATARRAVGRWGGLALVVGHFLPGGRTATTLAAGWLRFPRRTFGLSTTVAGVLWAIYISGLGWLGGLAFASRPLLGAVPGIVFGVVAGAFLQVRSRRLTAAPE
ncbi:DedA family protein [Cryptosporangium phraense]|uniref:DedA family protein n=1 Tax=Cryptosporangium phraense TaxID=2593070 RepID=A0A545AXV6_9ACTN|nr:VTT domain-containing protein [Cryptosporangium phraense]TQS46173.1 DedA family protein [Cryptosporangium phraense]